MNLILFPTIRLPEPLPKNLTQSKKEKEIKNNWHSFLCIDKHHKMDQYSNQKAHLSIKKLKLSKFLKYETRITVNSTVW